MADNSQRIDIRQGQSLTMTPQLQLSLKLLQFSSLELSSYIEEELQKNPLLERAEQEEDKASLSNESENETPAEESKLAEEKDITENISEENPLDVDNESAWESSEKTYDSYSSEGSSLSNIKTKNSNFDDGGASYYEQILATEVTLSEHITDQINLNITDPAKKLIAAHLIDRLDENGYISGDFANLQELLDCKESLIEEVLSGLQKCDPAGVFARSLPECLKLQLQDRNRFDPAIAKLLDNLDVMAKGDMVRLQKLCGVDKEDMREMCREIKSLNPRPGNGFIPEISQTAQADVFLRAKPDGGWVLELNNDAIPKVLVNNKYYAEIKQKTKNEKEKNYISEQLSSANWLVKSMHQRAETILKVATELVVQQEDFFKYGIYHLRPLVLNDIATALGIHESTVGRVTVNKYISTSRGLYEMKFFFSSSIQSSDSGDDYSSKTVKHIIKEMIDKETVDNVLSDDKIAEMLKGQGVSVARRTVAKYRESMNIPSSSGRKRQKKLSDFG